MKKFLRVILNLVAAKHPEMIEEIKGQNEAYSEEWLELCEEVN